MQIINDIAVYVIQALSLETMKNGNRLFLAILTALSFLKTVVRFFLEQEFFNKQINCDFLFFFNVQKISLPFREQINGPRTEVIHALRHVFQCLFIFLISMFLFYCQFIFTCTGNLFSYLMSLQANQFAIISQEISTSQRAFS